MANRYPLLYFNVALELRSLRFTIITRFIATTDLSAILPQPGLFLADFRLGSRFPQRRASHVDAFLLCTHVDATTPAACPRANVARFQSQLRSSPILSGLDAHINLFEACSTFIHISTCVLADPRYGTFCARGFDRCRYQQ